MSEESSNVAEALADLKEERVLELLGRRLGSTEDPVTILEECRQGMRTVGERFEKGEYFLSDLILSAEIFKSAFALLEPKLSTTGGSGTVRTVVFGTVQGDIHDVGKNIVVTLLRSHGFEVHDLGVDVPAASFVNTCKETSARILGLSGLITTSFGSMKRTIEALAEAKIRSQVRVMIGGGIVNERVRIHAGADAWGKDVMAAVKLAGSL
jgi:methanogenic corrinoid protein MtbC1